VSISRLTEADAAGTSTLLTSGAHWMLSSACPAAPMKESDRPLDSVFIVFGAALRLNAY
jgi:hypothetical protein